jgi:hypothetical protein
MTLAPRKQPAWVWFAAGIVATVLIGIMDVLADHGLSFLSLYFAPVLAVTWAAGRRAGYAICGRPPTSLVPCHRQTETLLIALLS